MAMEVQNELPPVKSGGSSFLRTCFNCLNALSGIGLITMPYTLRQAGWLSLGLFLAMALVTCYTGLLLQRCMDSRPLIITYPDIGWHAFGRKGRIIVSIFLYFELYLILIGFLILERDNLHKLFPNISFKVGGQHIGGEPLFTLVVGLLILPSIWLKDLRLLSFISASGALSSLIIICSMFWVGAVDGVGFSEKAELFNLEGVPFALSLYAFCYGAHAIFPTLHSSMEDKSQFSKVLFISFALSTLSYISMAIIGYLMFGQRLQSQVTLNLPTSKFSSKIAIYTTLVGPLAKYALVVTPIAEAMESQLPSNYNIRAISILIRTLLLISTVIVALVIPFFGLLMALIGSILSITVSILLPCLCYLKIFESYKRLGLKLVIILGVVVLALSVGVMGTYSSLKEMVKYL
ncbi:hypothetical protein ACB098_04G104700 [Castanea mollissima]